MLGFLTMATIALSVPNASMVSQVASPGDSVGDVRIATRLLDEFKEAWHSADESRIGSLFTEDGDLVIPTGELLHGKAKVAGFYASAFAHGYRGSNTSATIAQIRHLADDIMLIDAEWEISGAVTADGASKAPERGILFVILKREGTQWLVAALREQASATRVARL
jgi:uncharacterized protein (TIGR02246 family)